MTAWPFSLPTSSGRKLSALPKRRRSSGGARLCIWRHSGQQGSSDRAAGKRPHVVIRTPTRLDSKVRNQLDDLMRTSGLKAELSGCRTPLVAIRPANATDAGTRS